MNMVEKVKAICKERGIAIAKLERECGFANGYIRNLREGKMPADRLDIVENYLNVDHSYFVDAEHGKNGAKNVGNLSAKDIELLNAYHSSSDDIQFAIRRVLGI